MSTVLATPSGGVYSQLPELVCTAAVPGVQQICQVREVTEYAASAVGESWLEEIGTDLMESLASLLRAVMAWWTTFPTPELTSVNGQPAPVLASIREYTSGLQVVLLIAGILFAAARLAMAKRGGAAGEVQESFLMLARASFAAMTFGALITVATNAGDEFASWVVFTATRGDLDAAVENILVPNVLGMETVGAGFFLVVGLLGSIAFITQLVMLVVRQAFLVVVVAVLPLAAAASGTGPGSQSYKKLIAWSLAFVLWKPTGALVYAIAFTVIGGEDQDDPYMVLLGMILLLLTVIVLPALIRLINPAVAALGGGGGSAAVLAGAGVGVAMSAAGNRPEARKMSEGENSSGSGSSSGGGGSGPLPPGGGGGGRPMTAGSGAPAGGSGSGSTPSAGGTVPSAGGASAGAGAGSSGAAAAAGAMGAGPAGAAMMGAQMAVGALQSVASAAQDAVPEASAAQLDPDAAGPGEVRR